MCFSSASTTPVTGEPVPDTEAAFFVVLAGLGVFLTAGEELGFRLGVAVCEGDGLCTTSSSTGRALPGTVAASGTSAGPPDSAAAC
ncbi:hypothetical protein Are01nite_57800 [Actinoplanes regularis]|nr:hypothetical protein Are01nite_57800 [Actinoplanes regularis]